MKKHSIILIGLETQEIMKSLNLRTTGGSYLLHYGIPSGKAAVKKPIKQFGPKYPKETLHFFCEAGTSDYWIYQLIRIFLHCCYVITPSIIPKNPASV